MENRLVDHGDALRPVGPSGDEIIAQTRNLIEKVLPQVETRWPKKAKAA